MCRKLSIFLTYYKYDIFSRFVPCSNDEQCLKKVTDSHLLTSNFHNLFSTQCFFSQELGKQVTQNLKKTFLTANLKAVSQNLRMINGHFKTTSGHCFANSHSQNWGSESHFQVLNRSKSYLAKKLWQKWKTCKNAKNT